MTKEFGAIPRPVCSHDDIQSLRDKKKATAFSLHCENLTEGNLSTAGVEERAVNFKYCNSKVASSHQLSKGHGSNLAQASLLHLLPLKLA